MSSPSSFPSELLESPTEKRLNFFKNPDITFIHRNLKIAFQKTQRIILEPAGASIILVIGPSGVGKSTLLRLLYKKIIEESTAKMERNPGWIPMVCVEARAPGKGTFRWKSFYEIILKAVDEPEIQQKIKYDDNGIRRDSDGKLVITTRRTTEDALRLAMEKALIYRKPYTLAVDEFQHIGKMAGVELLQAHMDCVKSAVNITKVPWTGFGTYQLLDFVELSTQLSRRTKIIHFPRYSLEFDEDIKEFKRILEYLQHRMAFSETPPLRQKYWEFCYERSIGTIGTLKDWLAEAYDLALSENAKTLSLEHLKETAKKDYECENMALEAIKGEEKLNDSKQKSNNLRIILGLEKGKNQKSETSKFGRNTNPFKRNPKRDRIGGQ
ncbi:AAA family ATPase [Nostocaceae cyanobacterium CENA369]|uniref:AAA family ATPase n=1 Tax=Dendronalium phyllosphericum CENA369 TaxID=1725256 RepID=A0A8J7IWC0_9NOST|nr:AAA family ATPase [Dendronalium phyllosphericum]MBH8578327.1 AAA family ATPase [Dendronalium phyllosphericum CENA369]